MEWTSLPWLAWPGAIWMQSPCFIRAKWPSTRSWNYTLFPSSNPDLCLLPFWPLSLPHHPALPPPSQWPFFLKQWYPTFSAPGTGFMEDSFSMDQGLGGWFQDDSSTLHLLCTLFLLLLHQLRSSGIRFWRLGTPTLKTQFAEDPVQQKCSLFKLVSGSHFGSNRTPLLLGVVKGQLGWKHWYATHPSPSPSILSPPQPRPAPSLL